MFFSSDISDCEDVGPSRTMPDFESLKKETEDFEIKVAEFYGGKVTKTKDGSKNKTKLHEIEEVIFVLFLMVTIDLGKL